MLLTFNIDYQHQIKSTQWDNITTMGKKFSSTSNFRQCSWLLAFTKIAISFLLCKETSKLLHIHLDIPIHKNFIYFRILDIAKFNFYATYKPTLHITNVHLPSWIAVLNSSLINVKADDWSIEWSVIQNPCILKNIPIIVCLSLSSFSFSL